MNSYNDNLHTAVVTSLQTQELNRKQLKSDWNAAMFTLYHAEGATITAEEKLITDTTTLEQKTAVYQQAVANSNISINLLSSATQANSYLSQSVTNTAVAAANVQVAGNSIVRLASDVGSIFSIVNAADFDTDIYNLAKDSKRLINDTAYLAEVASDIAMDASINTSVVSTGTVLSLTKNANTLMGNMLAITTAEFNNASAVVATDNANISSTSVTEKAAEGNFEDISADYNASSLSYKTTNDELNLGLVVVPVSPAQVTSRIINFDLISSPFNTGLPPDNYPVQTYYLMIVNENKKTTFSITDAENILLTKSGNFIKMNVSAPVADTTVTPPVYTPSVITLADGTIVPYDATTGQVSLTVNFFNVNGKVFKDTDGKNMVLGQKYNAFIMAIYEASYKKKLNSFDDYLSAASPNFKMTNKLAKATDVVAGPNTPAKTGPATKTGTDSVTADASKGNEDPYAIHFNVMENAAHADKVEYRCMLLPGSPEVNSGLLTRSSFLDLEEEINQLQAISDKFDPAIAKYEAEIEELNMTIEQQASAEDGDSAQAATAGKGAKKSSAANSPFELLATAKANLAEAIKSRNDAITEIKTNRTSNFSFYFNLKLAEQVSAGNYLTAKKTGVTSDVTGNPNANVGYIATFGPAVTDNFGNMLIPGTYTVVVLSVFSTTDPNVSMFSNSWTGRSAKPLPTFDYSLPSKTTSTKPSKTK
jgi:hypothetical protein